MVNPSKKNDPRFWSLWAQSGAIPKQDKFSYGNWDASLFNPQSVEGVVMARPDNIYVTSEKSLAPLLNYLRSVGYDIKDIAADRSDRREKPSRLELEKNGGLLWFATLREDVAQRKAECGSCKTLISSRGVATHGHKCENCGDQTYLEYVRGGEVSFSVVYEQSRDLRTPTFVVHSYDDEAGILRFYVNPADCKDRRARRVRNFNLTPEQSMDMVDDLLRRFPRTFRLEEVEGIDTLTVNHKATGYIQEDSINPSAIEGRIENYRLVKLFRGKIFDEWAHLPVPESVSVYEAWHWAPLRPSPTLYDKIMSAAGQTSDKSFYYQDGRPAFDKLQIKWMLNFIRGLTALDARKIKKRLNPRLSGPDFIDTLARLSGNDDYIATRPNFGNTMVFLGKVLQGRGRVVTNRKEVREAWKGAYLDTNGRAVRETIGEERTSRIFTDATSQLGMNGNPLN